jgi:hypothetical protein
MPYKLKYYPEEDGYRVESIHGHVLSNKVLTYDKAVKQMKAVELKEHLIGGQKNQADWYLKDARTRALNAGYNPNDLLWSDDGIHKLMIKDDEGKYRYFGRVGYNDYIIYKRLEKEGKVQKGTADIMRERYHKSHSKIKGNWAKDKFSPNSLSLAINW